MTRPLEATIQLGLPEVAQICACGCGEPVPRRLGPGRPARYASGACRVRALRSRIVQSVTKSAESGSGARGGAGGSEAATDTAPPLSAPPGPEPAAPAAGSVRDPRPEHERWITCPVCSEGRHESRAGCWMGARREVYVSRFVGPQCPCCGWEGR